MSLIEFLIEKAKMYFSSSDLSITTRKGEEGMTGMKKYYGEINLCEEHTDYCEVC